MIQYYSNKGFSIIEAIATCVILGIVVVALINFFPTSALLNARADRQVKATLLAEELIESFRVISFDSLKILIATGNDSGCCLINPDALPGGWQYRRNWSLVDSNDVIQVEVRCSWPTPGGSGMSDVRVVTLISNYE